MTKKSWNPYLAGAATGILIILSVWISGKFFGTSTTFARLAALFEGGLGIDTAANAYFTAKGGKYGAGVLPDWQLLFVVGIFIGALISSRFSGEFKFQTVPDMWQRQFGSNPVKRSFAAFFGGVIALFGARLAGG